MSPPEAPSSPRCARGAALVAAWLALAGSGCSGALEDPRQGVVLRPSTLRSSEPTLGERFAECGRDPRLAAGHPTREACSGAGVFFYEPLPALARGCRAAAPAR